jgi:multidrug resistance efflux pump
MISNKTRLQLNSDELISDEIKEIISNRPHWMIRKGNMLFFLILICFLVLTWLISYPDIIKGSTKLVALNAPKLISSKTDGKIVKLFVANEERVQKGQHLGYMESTGAYSEVMALQQWIAQTITSTAQNDYTVFVSNPLPQLLNLGDLQPAYQEFQNQMAQTEQILSNGYYQKKKKAIEKDLQYLASLKLNTYEQQNLLVHDQQLQQKEYNAYEALEKDKVIAPLELNQYKSRLIAKEQNLKQIATQLTNSNMATHSKEKELMDLQQLMLDQQQRFRSSLLDLKSKLESWIQKFVFIAPENGKVLFVSSLQENELLTSGQNLFYIQPHQTKFYAELMAGQRGLGKIKVGQQVIIRVESYPTEEYGYIKGVVNYISNVASRRDSFLVKVDLPQGLKTNYHNEIFFRNNLMAQAEIITDNRKLFDRLLGQLNEVLKR